MSIETYDDILDEHKIWKSNSPLIYNLADFQTLDWPSLTCQWLPCERQSNPKVSRLILGTHTKDEENKLIISEYAIEDNKDDLQLQINEPNNNLKCSLKGRFQTIKMFDHKGEVNRARYMPQNPTLIATRSSENESFIYDKEKCILTLQGHSAEGYGLSWSVFNEGRLLTGSFDKKIISWDIQRSEAGIATPVHVMNGHSDKVEDVSWHPLDPNTFASVGDDKQLLVWDYRNTGAAQLRTVAHSDEANCVSWHPVTDHLLLTGGSDELVHLWDRRKLVNYVYAFETGSPVYRVAWSPMQETLFLSAGLQHRIHVWDIEKIGDEVFSHDEEDLSPPELALIHSGHTDAVTDIDWHPHLKSTVASVSEDNILNVWQINNSILDDD